MEYTFAVAARSCASSGNSLRESREDVVACSCFVCDVLICTGLENKPRSIIVYVSTIEILCKQSKGTLSQRVQLAHSNRSREHPK